MDKKRSILNITISITTRVILLVLAILVRRYLIQCSGNEANGLYSLYGNIIGFLAVAELGVGTAISFSMYKPIVDGDDKKVSALYNLYKKVYLIIGIIIAIAGVALLPLLPYLAKGYTDEFNLYLTFFLLLVSVVLTYAYSSKTSLINAYKNNYITTLINSISKIVRGVGQIVVLIVTKSFELFLVMEIVGTLVEWFLTEIYSRKKYKNIINTNEKVDLVTKQEVLKNTKAMFMHKIGGVLVLTADSIIISAFIGVIILGKYYNYVTIVVSMVSVLNLFFVPLTSIIGHLCAEKNIDEEKKYFKFMYFLNFSLGIIFFLGFYAVIDPVIAICFGKDLIMDKSISLIITINYFILFMRQSTLLFRDATGTFYNDRYKPIFEGIINIILSIAFVQWLGVVGVIVATIITNLVICHIVEPYVLYKHAFNQSPKKYYFLNYGLILIFGGFLSILHFCLRSIENMWLNLLVNGCIAVALALIPLIILFIVSKTYRQNVLKAFSYVFSLFKKLFKHKSEKID